MGTILFIAFLVILGIIIKKVVIFIKEELERREFAKRRLRDDQEKKEYCKEKILKNTLWFAPPKKARILVDTNILTYNTSCFSKNPENLCSVVHQWRSNLPKIVKAHQLKIIVLPEVYEELYQNGKKDAQNYLYEWRRKIPAENLEMELPLEHFGRRGRFADKKLLEYMLNNNGVYLFSFDQDLINRLLSRSSDSNVKKRICEQGFSISAPAFWTVLGEVVNEHFK